MNGNLNDSTSIYLQIAAMLEDNIVRDLLLEEEQAPSTNELAKAFQKRKDSFFETYVRSLVDEARTLAIGKEELMAMIEQAAADKT